jgi:hypothetical protein
MAGLGRAEQAGNGSAGQGRAEQARRGKTRRGRAGSGRAGKKNTTTKGVESVNENQHAVIEALAAIASQNEGMLKVDDVIEAARPASSPLHSKFTWDDTEAAHKWRQEQARALIRVTVHMLPSNISNEPVRVFVSLTPDRKDDGGGYRSLVSVMSRKDLREQLLADACADMERFQQKYAQLSELTEVCAAMKRAEVKQLKAA